MKIDPNAPAYPASAMQTCGMTVRADMAKEFMASVALYEYDAERAAEIAVHRADALIAELNRSET